nr:unnamed protein product [Callosobruchus analis]
MAMEDDGVMELELGEEIQVDSPRREREATVGQRPGGSMKALRRKRETAFLAYQWAIW